MKGDPIKPKDSVKNIFYTFLQQENNKKFNNS